MEEYYPYTVIPHKVRNILQEQIPLPKLPKLLPLPERIKRKYVGTIIFIVSFSAFIIVNFIPSVKNIFVNYFSFFVALISLVAMIFEFVHYGKLKKQYYKELKYYEDRQKAYKMVMQKIEKIKEDNENTEKVNMFRQVKIHRFFEHGYDTMNAVHNKYSPAKQRFKLFLEAYFPDEVLEDIKVVNRMKKINYVPDFVIKFENPKINIAIEIEEPYTLSNVPENIQKDYEAKDRLRQRFANELAWIVIILSEEQAVLHPTECCRFIEDSMSKILDDIKRNKEFSTIKPIERQRIISGKERAKLKANKYRESYLINAGLLDKEPAKSNEKDEKSVKNNKTNKPVSTKKEDTKAKKEVKKQVETNKPNQNKKVSEVSKEQKTTKKEELTKKESKVKEVVKTDNKDKVNKPINKQVNTKTNSKELTKKKTQSQKTANKQKIDYKVAKELIRKRQLDIQKKKLNNNSVEKTDDSKTENTVKKNESDLKEKEVAKKATSKKLEEKVVNDKKTEPFVNDVEKIRKVFNYGKYPKHNSKRVVAKTKNEADVNSKNTLTKEDKKQLMKTYHEQLESAVFDKKWNRLILLCNKAIKDLPDWDWAYYRRSTALGYKHEFKKVIADCDSALKFNKRFAEVYYNRATANYFLKQYEEAIKDYDNALAYGYIKPEEARFNKALCLYKLKKFDDAYTEFIKAQELGCNKSAEIIKKNFPKKKTATQEN